MMPMASAEGQPNMVSPLSLNRQVNLVESKKISDNSFAMKLTRCGFPRSICFRPPRSARWSAVRRYSLFRGANFRPSRRLSLYQPRWGLLSTYVRISLSHAACNPGLSMDEAVRVGQTVRNLPPAVI